MQQLLKLTAVWIQPVDSGCLEDLAGKNWLVHASPFLHQDFKRHDTHVLYG